MSWCIAASMRASDAPRRCSSPVLKPTMVIDSAEGASANFFSLSARRTSNTYMADCRLASPWPACEAEAVVAACCWSNMFLMSVNTAANCASSMLIPPAMLSTRHSMGSYGSLRYHVSGLTFHRCSANRSCA